MPENHEADLFELDDVLDHSYFSEADDLTELEDEFIFISDEAEDFRSLDEL